MYVSTYTKGTLKKRSARDLSNDANAMFFFFFVFFFFLIYKSIFCGYSFELHQQVNENSNGYP